MGITLTIGGLATPYLGLALPLSYALLAIPTGLATAFYGLTAYARSTNELDREALEQTLQTLCNTDEPLITQLRALSWDERDVLEERINKYQGQPLDELLTFEQI